MVETKYNMTCPVWAKRRADIFHLDGDVHSPLVTIIQCASNSQLQFYSVILCHTPPMPYLPYSMPSTAPPTHCTSLRSYTMLLPLHRHRALPIPMPTSKTCATPPAGRRAHLWPTNNTCTTLAAILSRLRRPTSRLTRSGLPYLVNLPGCSDVGHVTLPYMRKRHWTNTLELLTPHLSH